MKIKNFYLDLREGPQYAKQSSGVWLLESEAFKDPLKFTFEFENEDLIKMEQIKKDCESCYKDVLEKRKDYDDLLHKISEEQKLITKSYQMIQDLIERNKELEKKVIERNKHYEDILHNIGEALCKQDAKTVELKEKIKEFKNLSVYHYNQDLLLVGDEEIYGDAIEIPSGKYLIIEKKKYIAQNNYVLVEDVDPIQFKIEYIEKEYLPKFQIYSSNNVDLPICKVEFEVLFFQL